MTVWRNNSNSHKHYFYFYYIYLLETCSVQVKHLYMQMEHIYHNIRYLLKYSLYYCNTIIISFNASFRLPEPS